MPNVAIKDFFLSTQWVVSATSSGGAESTAAGKLTDVWTRNKIDWVV